MNDRLLVSIIVPCYNQAEYMEEALDSVIAQDYLNWECILVNDGSTDNTDQIAEMYCKRDNRFRYFTKPNGGLSSARNFGLEKSKGELIQFLDADDLLLPTKLSCHVRAILNFNVDIVYGCNRRFYNGDINFWDYPNLELPAITFESRDVFNRLILENAFVVHSALLKKEVFDLVGNFDVSLNCMEDWDFWIRCSLHSRSFHFVSDVQGEVFYRIKSESMSTNRWNMLFANYKIYNKYAQKITDQQVRAVVIKRTRNIKRDLLLCLYQHKNATVLYDKMISELSLFWGNTLFAFILKRKFISRLYLLGVVFSFRIGNFCKRISGLFE